MAERKSVSMQDLADKLGISKVTVSKALNGKDGVGEELKEKMISLNENAREIIFFSSHFCFILKFGVKSKI